MKHIAVALALLSFGCRRSTEATADATPPAPPVTAAAPTEPATGDDPLAPPPRDLPPAEEPRDNLTIDTGTIEEPGTTTVTGPKADPFDPAIASVRASALGCFSGMEPGEYSASIEVTVTAGGTATRVEVTAGPADPAVRKCLESAATRSYPATPGGRKLTITVQVRG